MSLPAHLAAVAGFSKTERWQEAFFFLDSSSNKSQCKEQCYEELINISDLFKGFI